jgi:hypothetical protein
MLQLGLHYAGVGGGRRPGECGAENPQVDWQHKTLSTFHPQQSRVSSALLPIHRGSV